MWFEGATTQHHCLSRSHVDGLLAWRRAAVGPGGAPREGSATSGQSGGPGAPVSLDVVQHHPDGSAEVVLHRKVPLWQRCLHGAARAATHCFRGASAPARANPPKTQRCGEAATACELLVPALPRSELMHQLQSRSAPWLSSQLYMCCYIPTASVLNSLRHDGLFYVQAAPMINGRRLQALRSL